MENHNFFNAIAARARQAAPREAGDYVDERTGLLFCGRCRTPRECDVRLGETVRRVSCLCACRQAEAERLEAARREAERQQRLADGRRACFGGAYRLASCTFAGDDRANSAASDACRRYAEDFEKHLARGEGLLLLGSVGTGKTFLAACVANALLERGFRVRFATLTRLTQELAGTWERAEMLDALDALDLLVADDVGTERDGGQTAELSFEIIDGRLKSGKPLLVTSNLTGADFASPGSLNRHRLLSRLAEACSAVVVDGADRRVARFLGRR